MLHYRMIKIIRGVRNMEMTVGRNEPCLCGSGKKYKKCCMNKQQVVHIHQAREERIAQQKHQLVKKMNAFIDQKIPFQEYIQLQSEFNQRSGRSIPENTLDGYVRFWLHFFYEHKNGLSGIEWYVKEEGHRLQADEKALASKWCELKPRIVQAINQTDDSVVFEDVFTSESFTMKTGTENLPQFAPWFGTVSIIEFFDDLPLFNGIRLFKGPEQVKQCVDSVVQWKAKHELSTDETIRRFLPELVGTLLKKSETENSKIVSDSEYMIEAELADAASFAVELSNRDEFVTYDWREDHKLLSHAENWMIYKDGYMNSEALMADSVGSLLISGSKLEYRSSDLEKVEQFNQLLLAEYKDQTTSILEIREQKKSDTYTLSDSMTQVTEGAPEYFAGYAQKAKEVERALKLESSPVDRELKIKQYEYEVYEQTLATYGKVDVTFDWNSLRSQFNLEPSPFVTGNETRSSSLKTVYYEDNQILMVKKEDIMTYEDLGFTPEELDSFYHDPIVEFYKLKTEGKGKGTVKKYRDSLYQLTRSLNMQGINRWQDCDVEFWKKMLLIDFFETPLLSQTVAKDLISTIKAFTKWLDQQHGTQLHGIASTISKELESDFLKAVKVRSTLTESGKDVVDASAAKLYMIEAISDNEMRIRALHSTTERKVKLNEKEAAHLEKGFIVELDLSMDHAESQINHLFNVYPQASKVYL